MRILDTYRLTVNNEAMTSEQYYADFCRGMMTNSAITNKIVNWITKPTLQKDGTITCRIWHNVNQQIFRSALDMNKAIGILTAYEIL